MVEQEERQPRPLFLICGMINTKDQTGYFRAFEGMVRHVYTVPVSLSDAGVPNVELAIRAQEAGLSAEPVASVANALMLLRDTWDDEEIAPRILIGGSLYLAGLGPRRERHAAAIAACARWRAARKFPWHCRLRSSRRDIGAGRKNATAKHRRFPCSMRCSSTSTTRLSSPPPTNSATR